MQSDNPNASHAWTAHDAIEAARRAKRASDLADAQPVRIVGVHVPFDDVFRLLVQVFVGQTIFVVIVLFVLRLLGVI